MADEAGFRSIMSSRDFVRHTDSFRRMHRRRGEVWSEPLQVNQFYKTFPKSEGWEFQILRDWRIWRPDVETPLSLEPVRLLSTRGELNQGCLVVGRPSAWLRACGTVFYGHGPVRNRLRVEEMGEKRAMQRERLDAGIPADVERIRPGCCTSVEPSNCERALGKKMDDGGEFRVVTDVSASRWPF